MATPSQIDANRRNALLSTGPRTAEGKSASSANALKHGLSAAFRVFPGESQQEFDSLAAAYTRDFAPASPHEEFLIRVMAESEWRLRRMRRLETALIEQMTADAGSDNPDAVLVAALLGNTAGPWKALQRYAADAERSYYRAFRQLQQARAQNEASAEPPTVLTLPARPAAPAPPVEIPASETRRGTPAAETPRPSSFDSPPEAA